MALSFLLWYGCFWVGLRQPFTVADNALTPSQAAVLWHSVVQSVTTQIIVGMNRAPASWAGQVGSEATQGPASCEVRAGPSPYSLPWGWLNWNSVEGITCPWDTFCGGLELPNFGELLCEDASLWFDAHTERVSVLVRRDAMSEGVETDSIQPRKLCFT